MMRMIGTIHFMMATPLFIAKARIHVVLAVGLPVSTGHVARSSPSSRHLMAAMLTLGGGCLFYLRVLAEAPTFHRHFN